MSSPVIYVRRRPRVGAELENKAEQLTDTAIKLSDSVLLFNPYDSTQPPPKFAMPRTRQNYDQRFNFRKVFDETSSDDEVYAEVVHSRLEAALQGQNVLVFAYGATGCGKSYTIGNFHTRFSDDLFTRIAGFPETRPVAVKLRYFEIYGEKPYDLLPRKPHSGSKRPALRICSDREGTRVQGICEYIVDDVPSMNQLIARGNKNRIVAATQANFQSSRSHAVLQIVLSQTLVRETGQLPIHQVSTFTIIDLAGNERALNTQNSGIRLREGGEINKSLLALGRCLSARAGITPCRPPYRDSCLTRLLQPSLEGSCQSSMIVCISPCWEHFEETRNSLLYGQIAAASPRSRWASRPGLPTRNQHPLEGRVKELEALVLTLQTKLDDALDQLNRERAEHAQALDRERRLRIPLPAAEDATTSALITKLSNISPRRRFRMA